MMLASTVLTLEMNDVSVTNTSLMVQIPGGMLPVDGSCTNLVPEWAHFKLIGSNINKSIKGEEK